MGCGDGGRGRGVKRGRGGGVKRDGDRINHKYHDDNFLRRGGGGDVSREGGRGAF